LDRETRHSCLCETFVTFAVTFLLPASSIHESSDAILEMNNIEVYKHSQRFTTQLQVRKDLSLMDRGDRVYGLEVNDKEILDKQIDPVSEVQPYAIVKKPAADWTSDR
jgi:hypothetical protein